MSGWRIFSVTHPSTFGIQPGQDLNTVRVRLRNLLVNVVKGDGVDDKQAMNTEKALRPRRFQHRRFGADDAVGLGDQLQKLDHHLFIGCALQQINMDKCVFTGIF
ncbi:Uncharacterised protein [Citrobacter freundii]|nr:Uncharacterised protein [Citrobacter freundii]